MQRWASTRSDGVMLPMSRGGVNLRCDYKRVDVMIYCSKIWMQSSCWAMSRCVGRVCAPEKTWWLTEKKRGNLIVPGVGATVNSLGQMYDLYKCNIGNWIWYPVQQERLNVEPTKCMQECVSASRKFFWTVVYISWLWKWLLMSAPVDTKEDKSNTRSCWCERPTMIHLWSSTQEIYSRAMFEKFGRR